MTVSVLPASDAEAAVWRTTLEVASLLRRLPWVLIGAQAIIVVALEHGRRPTRATVDVDVIVDVRAIAGGARDAAQRLVDAGFELSAEHDHRFVRGNDQVDVLAPDHLGPRTDLTTIPPRVTTEIPGGRRALTLSHAVDVEVAGVGTGTLVVPALPALLILKTSAWAARRSARDLEDLVRLLDIAPDPLVVRDTLQRAERQQLASIAELADDGHRAWLVARDPEEAQAALARIVAG